MEILLKTDFPLSQQMLSVSIILIILHPLLPISNYCKTNYQWLMIWSKHTTLLWRQSMNWGYNYLQFTSSLLSIKTGEPSILILRRFLQKASARIWGRRSNMHPWNPGYLIELCQPLSNKESAWQGSPHFFVKGKETSFQNQGTHNTTWWKQFDVLDSVSFVITIYPLRDKKDNC